MSSLPSPVKSNILIFEPEWPRDQDNLSNNERITSAIDLTQTPAVEIPWDGFRVPGKKSHNKGFTPPVTYEDGHFRRGPKRLSYNDIERLVKLGGEMDFVRLVKLGDEISRKRQTRRRRTHLKSLYDKFRKDVKEHVEQERNNGTIWYSPDWDMTYANTDELRGFGLEVKQVDNDKQLFVDTQFLISLS